MKLRFFDAHMKPLLDVEVGDADHWEACERGHELLYEGRIVGAEDFQVIETPHSSPFVHLAKSENAPIMEKLHRVA